MPRWTRARCLLWLAPILCAGCAESPMVLKGKLQSLNQQQTALSRQNQQFQDRAVALDRDNQELQASLAQSKQRVQVVEDQLKAVRDQLSGVTSQLAQSRDEKKATENKVQALTASLQRQGSVTITPNNSLRQSLPAINIPEVQVRADGDVVRIELPASRLFEPSGVRFRSGGSQLVSTVAAEMMRTYPEQMIGIEGHTDNQPLYGGQHRTHHEAAIARAMAVHEVLVNQLHLPASHFVVSGHGANHPVMSNTSEQGRERNRRVELVVYPDKAPR